MIDWLRGRNTPQTHWIDQAMEQDRLYLPPPVETELLSFPHPQRELPWVLSRLPRLDLTEGVWRRAGLSRRKLKALGLRAMLADALIAQCCIDAGATLITSDADFRHFAEHCGLKLAAVLE